MCVNIVKFYINKLNSYFSACTYNILKVKTVNKIIGAKITN